MLVLKRMSKTDPLPYEPCSWSTGTDAEIADALAKHYAGEVDLTEYWSIGDERTVHLSAMSSGWNTDGHSSDTGEGHVEQDVTFVLLNAGGKELVTPIGEHTECAFIIGQKDLLKNGDTYEGGKLWYFDNPSSQDEYNWATTQRRTWCNEIYYNALPASFKKIVKKFKHKIEGNTGSSSSYTEVEDWFALASEMEIFGTVTQGQTTFVPDSQFSHYQEKSVNIIKEPNASKYPKGSHYWTRTKCKNNIWMSVVVFNETSPSSSSTNANSMNLGIAPFGCI